MNDKGQLRLSRRALLPEADAENTYPTPQTGEAADNSLPKTSVNAQKDGVTDVNAERAKEKVTRSSSKSNSVEDSGLPQKKVKVFKRPASPAKDGPFVSRERIKKSNGKSVSSISSKEGSSLVDGEAKIG